ncbi:DUF1772 domain-containing protein [Nonomuraea soli]|uniref:Putative membrane protein n=1 Tax=Nonomuraea soli TaxID=1032476 RepID=A0A7W0CUI7_9ACTN|nr:anthrone oxygenase family protein [Nonomuraea soli]MBA2897601.1 putative membrane protein [Nonomuraea soli]
METLAIVLAVLAVVTTGALAGLFYAYSMSVMWGLAAIPEEAAAAAMRSINKKIINPWLMLAFIGSMILDAAVAVLTGNVWFWAALAVNFVGSFLVTSIVNVPMNNAVDAGKLTFAEYQPRWTRWNTLRTVASLASLALLAVGLLGWN